MNVATKLAGYVDDVIILHSYSPTTQMFSLT